MCKILLWIYGLRKYNGLGNDICMYSTRHTTSLYVMLRHFVYQQGTFRRSVPVLRFHVSSKMEPSFNSKHNRHGVCVAILFLKTEQLCRHNNLCLICGLCGLWCNKIVTNQIYCITKESVLSEVQGLHGCDIWKFGKQIPNILEEPAASTFRVNRW